MTTVVGIQGHNWAVVGADTRVVDDGRIFNLPAGAGKIVRKPDYIIALAGDFRPAQIFSHQTKYPKPPAFTTVDALDKFVTQKFLPAIKDTYREVGFVPLEDEGAELLVAIHGTIYDIGSDWSWARDKRGIYGVGSGSPYAIGAAAALGVPKNPNEGMAYAKQALSIACGYDNNSGEPLTIYQQVR